MQKCDCYRIEERYMYNPVFKRGYMEDYSYCNGTRERDECSCGGDKTKCDFYPEVREKAMKEIIPKFGDWISVEDRLPKQNDYYICWYRASKCGDKEDWKVKLLYWEDNIWLLDHRGFNVVNTATHWMPLPNAPEK